MANKINQIEIDSIIYDLQDKDAKAPFTGTKAEVQLAIAAGDIKEGDIVNITDDIGDYPGGDIPSGASNIVYLTQEQYDALPDDKLTDDIEYRITDEGTDTNADNVGYNNATSGLSAMNVQDAIDELSSRPSGGGGSNVVYLTQEAYDALPDNKLTNGIEYRIMDGDADETARNISYDNNESGLEAINVQQAIDKLAKGAGSGSASNTMYLTQAQYDELPESKLTDGVEYFITDTGVMGAANNVTYDNTNSGLEAINVQTAIDKVSESLGAKLFDSGWLTLSEEYGCYYRKKNGFVTVVINNTVSMNNNDIGVLPDEFKPSYRTFARNYIENSALLIEPDGRVHWNNSSNYNYACITYPV